MWVSYSYDVGSLSSGSDLFGFEIPEKYSCDNKISYIDLWNLLIEYQAFTNSSTTISYYDEEIGAYKNFSSKDKLSTEKEIQLLIHKSQISEIGSLLERIEDLETNISHFSSILKEANISIPSNQNQANSEHLDMAMLYAAPLTRKDGIKIKECDNWNLNFDLERKKLLEAFERSQIHASIRFETATLQHLGEILELQPKILHISCHGYYQKSSPYEFVLAFEDSKCLGMRDEVNQSRLKKILETHCKYFNIVIVSACFSQAIGNVFLDAGIDCVITIHDQCKILDDAAISFAVTFYRNLLRGKTIKNAFYEAKKNVNFEQAAMRAACCCAHNHKRQCLWKARNDHGEHTINEECTCEKRNNDSVHKLNCQWALKFLAKFNKTRVPSEQEIKQGNWIICCCSPEVPHNEAMKFKILLKNKEVGNQILFSADRSQNEIQEPYTYETPFKPPPIRQKIIGRNREMQQLLEMGKNNRVIVVSGKLGMGKSLLVKSVAHYACERRIFKHGVLYLNLQGKTNSSTINQMIAKSLNVPWEKSKEEIARIIENMHLLIILDNIGGIIAHNKEKVKNKIMSLLERTQFPKFWIVVSGENNLKLDRAAEFKLGELSKRAAAKLIKTRTEVYQKIRNDVLKLLNVVCKSPSELFQVMPVLMDKTVDEFLVDYQSHHSNRNEYEDSRSLYLSLTYLQNRKPEAVNFIKLLSLLPVGIFRENLNLICSQQTGDWKDALFLLESQEGEEWLVKIHLNDNENNSDNSEDEESLELRSSTFSEMNESLNSIKTEQLMTQEILMVSQPVKKYIKSEISPSAEDSMICMEYLCALARALMQVVSQLPSMACSNVMKSIGNFNALNPSPTWKLCSSEEIVAEILNTVKNSIIPPQKLFECMERNFTDYLSENYLRQIFKDHRDPQIGNLVFEMGQCVMCIYLLFGKKNQAFNVIDSMKKCLKTFTTNETLKHKLRLTWSAMKIEYKKKFRIQKAIKQAEKALQHFEINGMCDCLAESYLLKAIISLHAPLKRKEIYENRVTETSENLEKAASYFKDLWFTVGSSGVARTYLLYCEWKISNNYSDEEIVKRLQTCYKIFKELNLIGLEGKSLYLLGKAYFNMERLIAAEESWRFTLEIAQKFKDRKYEVEINEQLNLIFERIRRRSGNVIVVLRAFPLVSINSTTKNYILDSVVCTHFSPFKKNLLDTLHKQRKLIYMKFDVGTRQKLTEYIKEGCKVLHLSTCMPQMDSLVLENSNFSADNVSLPELDELFGQVSERCGLSLVVLSMPFSKKIGEYLYNQIGIEFVICFDYKEYPLCKYLTQLQLMFEKAIETFCEKFYALLVEGKTVKKAWKVAKKISDNFVDSNSKLFKHFNDENFKIEELYKGKGPILLGEGDKALFSDSSSDILSNESVLFPGNVLHTSIQGQYVNIKRTNSSLVGRHRAMFEVIEKLIETRLIHIVGPKGIGRSSLIKHIGYYMHTRQKFSDGIFWINMKSQGSLAQFNENLEKEGLFISFEGNDMEENLSHKNLLLMLDDCDDIIRESSAQFHNLIETLHHKYKISVIITSNPIELGYPCEVYELSPLEPLESASMLLACLERSLDRKEVIPHNKEMNIAQDLIESSLLKECMNLPLKIKELAIKLSHENFKVLEFKRIQNTDSSDSIPSIASTMVETSDSRWSDEEIFEEEKQAKRPIRETRDREHSLKTIRKYTDTMRKQKSKL